MRNKKWCLQLPELLTLDLYETSFFDATETTRRPTATWPACLARHWKRLRASGPVGLDIHATTMQRSRRLNVTMFFPRWQGWLQTTSCQRSMPHHLGHSQGERYYVCLLSYVFIILCVYYPRRPPRRYRIIQCQVFVADGIWRVLFSVNDYVLF